MDKPGALAAEVGTPSRFGISGILMVVVGAALVVYSLLTGT
jgi:glutaminase